MKALILGQGIVLATIGIYGVIAYGVAQRTAEIGLRLALGAQPRSVVGLVLGGGMVPVIAGIVVGIATLGVSLVFVLFAMHTR